MGISHEDHQRLFCPFSQVDGSTTRKFGGTGLGLSISKELVALMGGNLICKSEPGKGPFSLLTWTGIKLGKQSKVLLYDHSALRGLRILIIDDNPTNLEILTSHATSWGMKSECSSSGIDGITKLSAAQRQEKPFDIVILDYNMPEMDGGEVMKKIRADPTIAAVRIIMLTSVGLTAKINLMGKRHTGIPNQACPPIRITPNTPAGPRLCLQAFCNSSRKTTGENSSRPLYSGGGRQSDKPETDCCHAQKIWLPR